MEVSGHRFGLWGLLEEGGQGISGAAFGGCGVSGWERARLTWAVGRGGWERTRVVKKWWLFHAIEAWLKREAWLGLRALAWRMSFVSFAWEGWPFPFSDLWKIG